MEEESSDDEQDDGLPDVGETHLADLAEEVRELWHRHSAEPFEGAVLTLFRDRDTQILKGRVDHAGRDHARREVLRKRHATNEIVAAEG